MRPRCAARSDPSDLGAETRSGTRRTGVPLGPTAGAEPRSASNRSCVQWSTLPPRPRQAASRPPPMRLARGCPLSAAGGVETGSRSSTRSSQRHIRAVAGRAKQHRPADGGGEGLGLIAIHEREDAAAKTCAHDASAVAPLHPPRLLDERVHRGGGDFEIIAEAFVRLLQEPSELAEVAPP